MKANFFTIGSCRGFSFKEQGSVDIDKVIEEIKQTPEKDFSTTLFEEVGSFNDNVIEAFSQLMYNVNHTTVTKKSYLKFLQAIKRRKNVVEVWEEGTTGISVMQTMKELQIAVKLADRDSFDGEDYRSDVSDIFKEKK